jgi:hypothetical protein
MVNVNTLPEAILATLAIAHLSNPQAITIARDPVREYMTTAAISEQFTPEYRLLSDDGGKLIDVMTEEGTPTMANEVVAISELVRIGALLFKDSRDISEYEAEMMRAYLAKKYTEV